jgi:hypothetical protein
LVERIYTDSSHSIVVFQLLAAAPTDPLLLERACQRVYKDEDLLRSRSAIALGSIRCLSVCIFVLWVCCTDERNLAMMYMKKLANMLEQLRPRCTIRPIREPTLPRTIRQSQRCYHRNHSVQLLPGRTLWLRPQLRSRRHAWPKIHDLACDGSHHCRRNTANIGFLSCAPDCWQIYHWPGNWYRLEHCADVPE